MYAFKAYHLALAYQYCCMTDFLHHLLASGGSAKGLLHAAWIFPVGGRRDKMMRIVVQRHFCIPP